MQTFSAIFPQLCKINSLKIKYTLRVTIERSTLSKETYTVKHPPKKLPSCDVFRCVDACVGLSG